MKNSLSNVLLKYILIYTALSFYEPFWRLTMRAPLQGRIFSWDYAGIGGQGAAGGYPFIAFVSVLGLIILAFGWRKPNRFFRWSILIWAGLLFLSSAAIVAAEPGTMIVAETLGLELSYAWFIFPLDSIYLLITLTWFVLNRQHYVLQDKPVLRWRLANTIFLLLAVLFIPLEYVFFNRGELHGFDNQIAVALTFVQYGLINLSLYPWKGKVSIHKVYSK